MANQIPEKFTHNPQDLASYIKSFTKTDLEFVRAIYVWFSSPTGIDYDYDCLLKRKSRPSQLSLPVMKAKLGVCVGYSNIMVDACKSVGIMSEVIGGFVYPKEKDDTTQPYRHAWVIVKINGKFGLIDPTWGASFAMKDSINAKERVYRRLNNSYFFYHPFEQGKNRESYVPLCNLREPGIYSYKRNDIPINIHKAIKQYPELRKIIDDAFADASILMPINHDIDTKINEDPLLDQSEKFSKFFSSIKRLPSQYFLAKNNHVEVSHSGFLLNILLIDKNNLTHNLITLNVAENNHKGLLTKQVMFFIEHNDMDELLSQ